MSARFARAFAVTALCIALSACGFRPLYGRLGANPGAQRIFASVYVEPIVAERVGYQLRNSIIDLLDARDNARNAIYRLRITLVEKRNGIAVQNEIIAGQSSTTVTRYNYTLTAKYALVNATTNDVVTSGEESTLSAYNVTTSYATLIAAQDAQSRAAEDIAYRIRLDLGVYFAQHQPAA